MNNPLTVISGRAQLLATTLASQSDRTAADAIARAARELSDLITSLRLVADPPRPVLAPARVPDLAAAAINLAEARLCAPLADRITIHIPPTTPEVMVDSALLAAAISELIANAVQACANAPIDFRAQIAPADSRLEMSVIDHGPGMSPRALQHAFDPFFSEKPAGRRTGLGLTRARALVQLHSGDIVLDSRPGQGTTATIRLPLAAPAAQPTSNAA
jgi:signal transduction histidine kinase